MRQSCRELAHKYNAESLKKNHSICKGWDLPFDLSATACEGET